MTSTPTSTRALDARLHELLTGEKPWQHIDNSDAEYIPVWLTRTQRPGEITTLPHYHDGPIAIHAAEAALPEALREEYAYRLDCLIAGREIASFDADPDAGLVVNYDKLFVLIHATPSQRATAMVSVLERAREGQ